MVWHAIEPKRPYWDHLSKRRVASRRCGEARYGAAIAVRRIRNAGAVAYSSGTR
jgi:hypothetical protein